jgi:hypothetical protein
MGQTQIIAAQFQAIENAKQFTTTLAPTQTRRAQPVLAIERYPVDRCAGKGYIVAVAHRRLPKIHGKKCRFQYATEIFCLRNATRSSQSHCIA